MHRSSRACAPTSLTRRRSREPRPRSARTCARRCRRAWIEYGANAFGGFADFYANDVAASFARRQDSSAAAADLKTANTAAAAAMQRARRLAARSQQRDGDAATSRIGAAMFSRMLEATEQVELPLERSRRDRSRGSRPQHGRAARRVSAVAAGRQRRRVASQSVRAHKPADGPVRGSRAQLPDARGLRAPVGTSSASRATSKALVAEAPPYNAQNFAYINPPGPYEKNLPAIVLHRAAGSAVAAEQRAQYILPLARRCCSCRCTRSGRVTSCSSCTRTAVASRIGQLFVGYAFAEGWAHYAEEMMWDSGLAATATPRLHVGQLMQRAAGATCAIAVGHRPAHRQA